MRREISVAVVVLVVGGCKPPEAARPTPDTVGSENGIPVSNVNHRYWCFFTGKGTGLCSATPEGCGDLMRVAGFDSGCLEVSETACFGVITKGSDFVTTMCATTYDLCKTLRNDWGTKMRVAMDCMIFRGPKPRLEASANRWCTQEPRKIMGICYRNEDSCNALHGHLLSRNVHYEPCKIQTNGWCYEVKHPSTTLEYCFADMKICSMAREGPTETEKAAQLGKCVKI